MLSPSKYTLCTLACRFVFVRRLFHRLWLKLIRDFFLAEGESKEMYIHNILTVSVPLQILSISPLNWFIDPIWKFTIWPLWVLYFPSNRHIWRIMITAETQDRIRTDNHWQKKSWIKIFNLKYYFYNMNCAVLNIFTGHRR